MATVVICGGLGCIKRDVVPVGLAHALASERLRQATTDCSKDLTRSASLASLATSGSLNSLNDDDVGPTKAIDENDLEQTNYYELLGLEKSGIGCLLYTSPSPRDQRGSRMPSSA